MIVEFGGSGRVGWWSGSGREEVVVRIVGIDGGEREGALDETIIEDGREGREGA